MALPFPAGTGIVVLGEGRRGAAARRPRRRPGWPSWHPMEARRECGRTGFRQPPVPGAAFVGASIAVIRGDRVLLAARANEPMRRVWTLPGGLVEAGESWPRRPCANCPRRSACRGGCRGGSRPPRSFSGTKPAAPDITTSSTRTRPCGAAANPWPAPRRWGPGGRRSRRSATLPTTPGLVDTLREAFARVDAHVDAHPARTGGGEATA